MYFPGSPVTEPPHGGPLIKFRSSAQLRIGIGKIASCREQVANLYKFLRNNDLGPQTFTLFYSRDQYDYSAEAPFAQP
jgi:hypothetical protein